MSEPPVRTTVALPAELSERVRNAVYWTPGITLTALVTRGLEREVESLEATNGGAFDQRPEPLRGGRPIGS